MLIDEAGTCKVCDFGVSKPLSSLTMTGVCYGTIQYTSPEILKQSRRYTVKCDVYSFAILMYELFFMVQPYTELPPSPIKKQQSSVGISSGSSASQLSEFISSDNSGTNTTFCGADMMNIFSIGTEVIQGRRPMIPWENSPFKNNALQIQSESPNEPQDENTLKCEWYLHCNKQKSKNELTEIKSLIPAIDRYLELMKSCWEADDERRPDFSEVLDILYDIEDLWNDVAD